MSQPIESYGFIGNMVSGALVGRDGSIDWLCLPRFDSDACFAALLGTPEHGRWLIAPQAPVKRTRRRYRPGTAILETTFETAEGEASVIDFMPRTDDEEHVDLIRMVRGVRGRVRMRMELIVRFGYGTVVPWVRRQDFGIRAIAGPDALELAPRSSCAARTSPRSASSASARVPAVPFMLDYHPSHRPCATAGRLPQSIEETERFWAEWSGRCRYGDHAPPHWRDAVVRSLITLKCLTYQPTGGIIAAPTTSLPERLGGVRNWDYRYCWIRDATLTLYALLNSGYRAEALAWREWLVRAAAGRPAELQAIYGIAGERRLTELELPWLPGYEGSRPVRIGNAAFEQLQLDVYGELMDAAARRAQVRARGQRSRPGGCRRRCWTISPASGSEPDEGIWEVRGPRRHFTHSKVMAWVAFDRSIKAVECLRPVRPARGLARGCAPRSTQDICATRLRCREEQLRAVLRRPGRRCLPAADPAGRLPAARGSARPAARSRRSSAS